MLVATRLPIDHPDGRCHASAAVGVAVRTRVQSTTAVALSDRT